MSTHINDLASAALLHLGLAPQNLTSSVTGNSCDLISNDGACFAMQLVGDLSGTGTMLAGKLQESADNSTWADIPGASFANVSTVNVVQAISFRRSQRYLRYVGTISGTTPEVVAAVLIGGQRKQI
jgi:hypothetical protein